METMNIAVPDGLKAFVQTRVAEGGYSSVSEYVRELIRADQKQQAWAVVEAEVLKGLSSGPAVAMTAEDWASIRAEVRNRIETRKKKSG
jgi:antitoxin ParD1/3/4